MAWNGRGKYTVLDLWEFHLHVTDCAPQAALPADLQSICTGRLLKIRCSTEIHSASVDKTVSRETDRFRQQQTLACIKRKKLHEHMVTRVDRKTVHKTVGVHLISSAPCVPWELTTTSHQAHLCTWGIWFAHLTLSPNVLLICPETCMWVLTTIPFFSLSFFLHTLWRRMSLMSMCASWSAASARATIRLKMAIRITAASAEPLTTAVPLAN